MWCRPRSPVEPMYMPGRLRTASSPSRTVMELPEYVFSVFGRATTWGPSVAQPAHDEPPRTTGAQGRRTALSRLLAVSDLQSTRPYDRNDAVHALRSCLRHAGLVGHQRCCLLGRHAVPGPLGRSGSTDFAVPAIRCPRAGGRTATLTTRPRLEPWPKPTSLPPRPASSPGRRDTSAGDRGRGGWPRATGSG